MPRAKSSTSVSAGTRHTIDGASDQEFRNALLAMEDDLHIMSSAFAGLKIFGHAAEEVDSRAVGLLARIGGEAMERVMETWRELLKSS